MTNRRAGRMGALAGGLCSLCALCMIGCGPPPAPADIDGLGKFLYRAWSADDPTEREDGMTKLRTALSALMLSGGLDGRSFQLTPLGKDDLTVPAWPMDRDPKNLSGGSVARPSRWPVTDFARLQTNSNLLSTDTSASDYQRTFVDPTDPTCFSDRTCLEIHTDNQMTRSNDLYAMTFLFHKEFRWVQIGDDWAILGRDWLDHSFPFSRGDGDLYQSYTLDVFLGRPDGTTWRYQASWSETRLPIDVTMGLQLAIVTNSIDGSLKTTDDVIQMQFHGM